MLKITEIEKVLRDNLVPAATIIKITNELESLIEEAKPEPTGPKAKNQYVILLDGSDTTHQTGWITQIPEGEDVATVPFRLSSAVKDFNANTRKGRKKPIRSFVEAFESVQRKQTKAANVMVKTKELTRVIILMGNP